MFKFKLFYENKENLIGPLYHTGTFNPKKSEKFNIGVNGAIFFTDDPELNYKTGKGTYKTIVYLKGKFFDFRYIKDLEKLSNYLKLSKITFDDLIDGSDAYNRKEWVVRNCILGNYDAFETPEFREFSKKYKYDGYICTEYGRGLTYAVYDPDTIIHI